MGAKSLRLERWRWLPPRFAAPPLVVNIPEFRMHAGDPGQRWSMKVVVGKAYRHRTPVFAAEMKHVVFRPYWMVPPSIVKKELAPKIARMGFDHLEIPIDDPKTLDFKKCGEIIRNAGISSISCCGFSTNALNRARNAPAMAPSIKR